MRIGNMNKCVVLEWIIIILTADLALSNNITDTTITSESSDIVNTELKLLSRRKRFLIFPDGSSFQLVFCTQTHGYLQVGDIVWFGTTAALAWELPTDPQVFSMFRDRYKVYEGTRRSDVIYYVDEDGKVIDAVAYHRKPIVNPAFAKRSIPSTSQMSRKPEISVRKMHSAQSKRSLFKDLDATRMEFHRNERKNLYFKLEKFFQELGSDGRNCVLRMLCEAAKPRNYQGTFVDEIITAIFTLPKGLGSESKGWYDGAQETDADCSRLYPQCLLYVL